MVPGSLFVLMSIFALTTLVGASVYYRQEDAVVYELTDIKELEALLIDDDDDVVEIETPEPFTYTDAIEIGVVEDDDAIEVDVVEDDDTDFTKTIAFKLPEIDIEEADKELTEALNEEMSAVPAWTEEPKEASAETDDMINELFRDVDDDGAPTLDPDVKVQSYILEESVIEDEYIPVPEEDEAESIELELEDLVKTIAEGLDTEIDTTKVIAVMADGKESINLDDLDETVAMDTDANLVDDDVYDKTIAVDKDM
jgi:hypothetical protein